MGQLSFTTKETDDILKKAKAMPDKVLPAETRIPSKTSELTNDSEFVTSGSFKTINGNSILGSGNLEIGSSGGGGVADSVEWNKVLNKPSWINSDVKPKYSASEVGALPSSTAIPSKTSELTNDSGFLADGNIATINGQKLTNGGNIEINLSGGGSQGCGNVMITNESALKATKTYLFKPKSDGSTEGTYEEFTSDSVGNNIVELPSTIYDILVSETTPNNDEWLAAIGGVEGFYKIYEDIINGKIFILRTSDKKGVYTPLEFKCNNTNLMMVFVVKDESFNDAQKIVRLEWTVFQSIFFGAIKYVQYTRDMILPPELFDLTGDSTSDEIKAVFSTDFFKRIIKLAGHRRFQVQKVIESVSYSLPISVLADKNNNTVSFSVLGFGTFGLLGGIINITYDEGSDTYSAFLINLATNA